MCVWGGGKLAPGHASLCGGQRHTPRVNLAPPCVVYVYRGAGMETTRNCALALCNFSGSEAFRSKIIESGALARLVSAWMTGEDSMKDEIAVALCQLTSEVRACIRVYTPHSRPKRGHCTRTLVVNADPVAGKGKGHSPPPWDQLWLGVQDRVG